MKIKNLLLWIVILFGIGGLGLLIAVASILIGVFFVSEYGTMTTLITLVFLFALLFYLILTKKKEK